MMPITFGMIFISLLAALMAPLPLVLSRHHPKCLVTLTSAAYMNGWTDSKVKWKKKMVPTEDPVDVTLRGRVRIPTNLGGTTRSALCFAQLRVNLTDCTMILSENATAETGWTVNSSPIYKNQETWPWNTTIEFNPACPENLFVEVHEESK